MSFLHLPRKSRSARHVAPSPVEIALILAAVIAACLAGIASGSFTSV